MQMTLPPPHQTYDYLVIGAGVAGLNALNTGADYLPKGATALLLDQKDRAGGMWNTVYDFVRLHQPHQLFTVGNMKWGVKKPPEYLSDRNEVQSHLATCLKRVAHRMNVEAAFGQTVSRFDEIETPQGPMVEVVYHPNGAPSDTRTVWAKRAVHAAGSNPAIVTPLSLSSNTVLSIAPADLRRAMTERPGMPVVVVGGGKTGMDTALAALTEGAGRPVVMIKGRGTNFLNRTKHFPTGLRRWTSGSLVSGIFRDVSATFDGTNEDETQAYFRRKYSSAPDSDNGVNLFGIQSEEEQKEVESGVDGMISGYLEDVIAGKDTAQMVMRNGQKMPLHPEAIVVNCTGAFYRRPEMMDPMPILSPHGTLLSINMSEAFHLITSVSSFLSTHLWWRDRLRGHGFYTLDQERLFHINRNALSAAAVAQMYMNQVLAVQNLPLRLLDQCGLDYDRWYPLPRRALALARMKMTAKTDVARCSRALDRVSERFGVHAAHLT